MNDFFCYLKKLKEQLDENIAKNRSEIEILQTQIKDITRIVFIDYDYKNNCIINLSNQNEINNRKISNIDKFLKEIYQYFDKSQLQEYNLYDEYCTFRLDILSLRLYELSMLKVKLKHTQLKSIEHIHEIKDRIKHIEFEEHEISKKIDAMKLKEN